MKSIHLSDMEIKYSLHSDNWSECRGRRIVEGNRVLTIHVPPECKNSGAYIKSNIVKLLGLGDETQIVLLEESRLLQ